MKFFTRERYDATQHDSLEAERDWNQAGHDYSKHLEQIRAQLPQSARELLGLTLHDGIVGSVGEFYEVSGDLKIDPVSGWNDGPVSQIAEQRHFLFYLRDETFECT